MTSPFDRDSGSAAGAEGAVRGGRARIDLSRLFTPVNSGQPAGDGGVQFDTASYIPDSPNERIAQVLEQANALSDETSEHHLGMNLANYCDYPNGDSVADLQARIRAIGLTDVEAVLGRDMRETTQVTGALAAALKSDLNRSFDLVRSEQAVENHVSFQRLQPVMKNLPSQLAVAWAISHHQINSTQPLNTERVELLRNVTFSHFPNPQNFPPALSASLLRRFESTAMDSLEDQQFIELHSLAIRFSELLDEKHQALDVTSYSCKELADFSTLLARCIQEWDRLEQVRQEQAEAQRMRSVLEGRMRDLMAGARKMGHEFYGQFSQSGSQTAWFANHKAPQQYLEAVWSQNAVVGETLTTLVNESGQSGIELRKYMENLQQLLNRLIFTWRHLPQVIQDRVAHSGPLFSSDLMGRAKDGPSAPSTESYSSAEALGVSTQVMGVLLGLLEAATEVQPVKPKDIEAILSTIASLFGLNAREVMSMVAGNDAPLDPRTLLDSAFPVGATPTTVNQEVLPATDIARATLLFNFDDYLQTQYATNPSKTENSLQALGFAATRVDTQRAQKLEASLVLRKRWGEQIGDISRELQAARDLMSPIDLELTKLEHLEQILKDPHAIANVMYQSGIEFQGDGGKGFELVFTQEADKILIVQAAAVRQALQDFWLLVQQKLSARHSNVDEYVKHHILTTGRWVKRSTGEQIMQFEFSALSEAMYGTMDETVDRPENLRNLSLQNWRPIGEELETVETRFAQMSQLANNCDMSDESVTNRISVQLSELGQQVDKLRNRERDFLQTLRAWVHDAGISVMQSFLLLPTPPNLLSVLDDLKRINRRR